MAPPPFFDRIVQDGQCGCRSRRPARLDAHFLQDGRNTVADSRGRGEGEINDAETRLHPFGCPAPDEFPHPRDLEGRLLDDLGELSEVGVPV